MTKATPTPYVINKLILQLIRNGLMIKPIYIYNGEFKMLNTISKVGFLVFLAMFLTACANSPSYHKYLMRGQVMSVDENGAVICIGNNGNSIEGKTLNVYRAYYGYGAEEGDAGYKVRNVGVLKGGASINDHFAQATWVEGDIKEYDFVKFKQ